VHAPLRAVRGEIVDLEQLAQLGMVEHVHDARIDAARPDDVVRIRQQVFIEGLRHSRRHQLPPARPRAFSGTAQNGQAPCGNPRVAGPVYPGATEGSETMAEDPRKHLHDLVKDFDAAMLVTFADGGMHARPMAVAEINASGSCYFATSIAAPKVDEIAGDPRVLITFQGKTRFATVSGTARIVRDRALVERLWSESWRVWFPDGKDDPTLCLLAVEAHTGELWDSSGLRGIKYAYDAAKAYITGKKPGRDDDPDQHAKVRL
jgi:general stress protein 26